MKKSIFEVQKAVKVKTLSKKRSVKIFGGNAKNTIQNIRA